MTNIDETRRAAIEALAESWASIDGKLYHYVVGKDSEFIEDEPGGHTSGYFEDAKEMIKRLEKRGFTIVKKTDKQ